MRFGHYTVFDTPEENKHTQVYVEYDVPNNDNLDGATGTMILSDGGEGSGGGSEEDGNGIMSISISPSITTTPALDSMFPINWEDLPEGEIVDGVEVRTYDNTIHTEFALTDDAEYSVAYTPSSEWHIDSLSGGGEAGETVTTTETVHRGALILTANVKDANGTMAISASILITE